MLFNCYIEAMCCMPMLDCAGHFEPGNVTSWYFNNACNATPNKILVRIRKKWEMSCGDEIFNVVIIFMPSKETSLFHLSFLK